MEYDTEKYQVIQFPHYLVLFYLLVPILAINEVFLGQRQPKVLLIDMHSKEPPASRLFVPCPACETIHSMRLWRHKQLGHWLGPICPKCETRIPCLRNFTSVILLFLLFPFWYPIKLLFEKRFIAYELRRSRGIVLSKTRNYSPLLVGAIYAAFMYVVGGPLLHVEELSDTPYLYASICIAAGFAFAFLNWIFANRKKYQSNQKIK